MAGGLNGPHGPGVVSPVEKEESYPGQELALNHRQTLEEEIVRDLQANMHLDWHLLVVILSFCCNKKLIESL